MKMINRIIMVIGILGAVAAVEGLNRFAGLVSAFGGGDTPYYVAMLIVAVIGAVVLLAALFNKTHSILKWVMVVLLLGSAGLMLNAPAFPVNIQIIVGLFAAALATGFIKTNK
jgi:uncharacterized membrane protein YeaQ/YmgE (transglycosylase-associated protein family)